MMARSLRARIVLAFLTCVGVSVLAFAGLLALGLQLRSAQAVSQAAVATNRAAVLADQRSRSAEIALYRYLNTNDVADRQRMNAALETIRGTTVGDAALLAKFDAGTALIERSQGAAVVLLDTSGNLTQSLVILGELGAALADPEVNTLIARTTQAYGLLATNVGRLVALTQDRTGDSLGEGVRQMAAALAELQAHPAATARLKKVAGVILRDTTALSASVDAYRTLIGDRRATLSELTAGFAKISAELQVRSDAASAGFAQAGASEDKASGLMINGLLVTAPLVLVIGLGLALAVVRSVTRPVVALTHTMARLAEGDYRAAISGQDRLDELGAMARAVDVFKANGLSLLAKDREAEQHRQAVEAERARHEAARAEAAEQQAAVVSSIGLGLARLAGGDLTVRMDDTFPDEYRTLQTDFNDALGKLQEAVGTVVRATGGLRSGAVDISRAADDLSRRTEQTAASLEQTAAALDEITVTVNKTAAGASNARDVVVSARSDAEQSSRVVQNAIAAVGAIEKSAREIAQTIGVIDEIAFQINLLALNAGIEAARAGDAGRGFAVVASEVRSLAQRSTEAARSIKTLITTSSVQVEKGVVLVKQTGDALVRIAAKVHDITDGVAAIAASAHEQSTALQGVNSAVNQMDQATQQNAAMVQQTTAASHSLAGEADQLTELVSHFHVGEHAAAA